MGVHIKASIPAGATQWDGSPREYLVLEDIQVVDDEGRDLIGAFQCADIRITSGRWGGQIMATMEVLVDSIDISDVPFRIENGTHKFATHLPVSGW